MHAGGVIVKCQQTGKKLTVKVKDLSCEDGSVPVLVEGAEVLAEVKGKPYPVKFIEFQGTCTHIHLSIFPLSKDITLCCSIYRCSKK